MVKVACQDILTASHKLLIQVEISKSLCVCVCVCVHARACTRTYTCAPIAHIPTGRRWVKTVITGLGSWPGIPPPGSIHTFLPGWGGGDGEFGQEAAPFPGLCFFLKPLKWGVSVMAQWEGIPPGTTMRLWVRSLTSLSGLRIRRCCELWCRSQTWLRFGVAVAVA